MTSAVPKDVVKRSKRKSTKIEPWACGSLRIKARGDWFQATGTVSVAGVSIRLRKTLDVRAAKENRNDAEREARRLEAEARAKLGGAAVRQSVATLVAERFKSHIGPSDQRILREFTAHFTTRILYDIAPELIVAFVTTRQRKNKAETKERYISTILAFMKQQVAQGQYPALPIFVRDQQARNPETRSKRPVQQFRIELLADIIVNAHITIGIHLHVEYVCGARISSLLQGANLGDLDMVRMVLTFRKTKNGEDVPCAIPESIREPLEEYLAWRAAKVREGVVPPGSAHPLFLTYKGKPYKPNNGAWGAQNKTGFNAAKRRALKAVTARYDQAIASMEAAGDEVEVQRLLHLKADDLSILARITQHWLRHKFATDVGRRDLQAAKRQGGWKSTRSILGYLIDDAEYQRQIVEDRASIPIDLNSKKAGRRT